MPSKPQKAKIECRLVCGICGRTETEIYVNPKSIAALKERTKDWVYRPKQEYSICPECYAQHVSRKKKDNLEEETEK